MTWRGNTGELRLSKAHVDLWCMVNPTAWAEFQLCLHITPCEESHLLISVDVVERNWTIGHCGGTVDWICVAFSLPSFPVLVFIHFWNSKWLIKHNVIKNEYWHLSIKFYWKAIAVYYFLETSMTFQSPVWKVKWDTHTDYSAVFITTLLLPDQGQTPTWSFMGKICGCLGLFFSPSLRNNPTTTTIIVWLCECCCISSSLL